MAQVHASTIPALPIPPAYLHSKQHRHWFTKQFTTDIHYNSPPSLANISVSVVPNSTQLCLQPCSLLLTGIYLFSLHPAQLSLAFLLTAIHIQFSSHPVPTALSSTYLPACLWSIYLTACLISLHLLIYSLDLLDLGTSRTIPPSTPRVNQSVHLMQFHLLDLYLAHFDLWSISLLVVSYFEPSLELPAR